MVMGDSEEKNGVDGWRVTKYEDICFSKILVSGAEVRDACLIDLADRKSEVNKREDLPLKGDTPASS